MQTPDHSLLKLVRELLKLVKELQLQELLKLVALLVEEGEVCCRNKRKRPQVRPGISRRREKARKQVAPRTGRISLRFIDLRLLCLLGLKTDVKPGACWFRLRV